MYNNGHYSNLFLVQLFSSVCPKEETDCFGNSAKLSRSKWINTGEKPTNHFLNFENRNFTNKVIPKLTRTENNKQTEVTKQSEILSEVENFYKTLNNL